MKTIKELRETLGLTQRDLAKYLEISRSQLAMYETGKRKLGSDLIVKLASAESKYHASKNNRPVINIPEPESQTIQGLRKSRINIEYSIYMKRRRLQDMQTTYEANSRLFHVLELLQTESSIQPITWIESRKIAAQNKMTRNAPYYQESLDKEIQALCAQIQAIDSLLVALNRSEPE